MFILNAALFSRFFKQVILILFIFVKYEIIFNIILVVKTY